MTERAIRSFDEIEIGDEIGPVTRVPTTEMVVRYAEAAGIRELRFFFDPEQARQNGFEKPIVPGPLSAGFLAQLLKDHFVGWQLRALHTTFRTPALHGEPLNLWGTITEKTEENGVPTVHCDILAENPRGDRVIVGTATLHWRAPRE
jgi:acyl dehydratase